MSKAQTSVEKEEHAKRLKTLRKELEYLDKTNWQFEPIDKLLGGINWEPKKSINIYMESLFIQI